MGKFICDLCKAVTTIYNYYDGFGLCNICFAKEKQKDIKKTDVFDKTKCPNCCNCIKNLRQDITIQKERANKFEVERNQLRIENEDLKSELAKIKADYTNAVFEMGLSYGDLLTVKTPVNRRNKF